MALSGKHNKEYVQNNVNQASVSWAVHKQVKIINT